MKNQRLAGLFGSFAFQAFCLLVVVTISVGLFRRSAFFANEVELPLYDLTTRLTWPWKAGHPDVVLVTIQNPPAGEWPLKDDVLAKALEWMLEAEPSVIGIDLRRDAYNPRNAGSSDERDRLDAIALDERLVWVSVVESGSGDGFGPPAFLDGLSARFNRIASANSPIDGSSGRMVRRVPLVSGDWYSLSALLALKHAARGLEPEQVAVLKEKLFGRALGSAGGYWLTDEAGVPADEDEFLLKPVPQAGSAFEVYRLPVEELVDGRPPEPLHAEIRGKVVLFGTHGVDTAQDEVEIAGDPALRGIKVHALATAQLLRELEGEAPVGYFDNRTEDLAVMLAAALALGVLMVPRLPQGIRAAGAVGVVPVLVFGCATFLLSRGTWLPAGAPMISAAVTGIGGLVLQWRTSERSRNTYLDVMSRHLGADVMKRVLARNELLLAGQEKPPETFRATILFGDLRGYTGISQRFQESGPADSLFTWLNGILRPAVEITGRHGGFVKQFAGDGIFVVFGFPPEAGGDHARRAVDCAREIARLVPKLNESAAKGAPPYQMRIGIYTGPVHAAAVGGRRNADYSIIGPTVNKAARLESLRKDDFKPEVHPVRILVGDPTREALEDPAITVPFDDGPTRIDSNLPPEQVWRILS